MLSCTSPSRNLVTNTGLSKCSSVTNLCCRRKNATAYDFQTIENEEEHRCCNDNNSFRVPNSVKERCLQGVNVPETEFDSNDDTRVLNNNNIGLNDGDICVQVMDQYKKDRDRVDDM